MIGPSPGYQRFYYVHPVVFSSHCWRGTGIRGPTTNLRRPWIGGMAHHTPHLGEGTRLPSNVCGEFDIVWPASKLQKGAPKSGLLFHDDHAFFQITLLVAWVSKFSEIPISDPSLCFHFAQALFPLNQHWNPGCISSYRRLYLNWNPAWLRWSILDC